MARRHLTLACYKGDVAAISDLLQQGAGVDQQDYDGYTPLFVASSRGHVDAARLLLDKGAEVHRAEENGRTPLYIVCWNGHVDAARLLLDKGAEVDRATEDGRTLDDGADQIPGAFARLELALWGSKIENFLGSAESTNWKGEFASLYTSGMGTSCLTRGGSFHGT